METLRDIKIVIGNIFLVKMKIMFISLEMEHELIMTDIFGSWEE